jgi:hypothetical protein
MREQRQNGVKLSPVISGLYSFFVLLFTMVGNAQISGIDVVFAVLGPVCVFLFFLSQPVFRRSRLVLGFVTLAFACVFLLISARYPMLSGYVFWPMKAVLVALFVTQTAPSLRAVQVHLIFVFALFLFMTSSEIDGRAVGFFGPNMLYRFYGLLLLTASFMLLMDRKSRPIWISYMLFAVVGILRTGSVGGGLLILVAAILFLRPSVRSIVVIATLGFGLIFSWTRLQELVLVQRLMLKITYGNFESSSRFDGIEAILREGLLPFGHSYDTFNHVWREGYEYPHNVFVELLAFFGLLGLMVSAVIAVASVLVWRRIYARHCDLFDFAFAALFIGAQLSGDLSDNYGVVGLSIAVFLRAHRNRSEAKIDRPDMLKSL